MPGQLRVLAGDIEGDSMAVLGEDAAGRRLLLDRQRPGGADALDVRRHARKGGASFVLDRGAKVTHFNYFANARSVQAPWWQRLTQTQPADFRLIGPLSWAGRTPAARARRGRALARPRQRRPPGRRAPGRVRAARHPGQPPGAGRQAHLARAAPDRRAEEAGLGPAAAERVTPDGPIGLSYDDLIDHLAATHEVIEFAYDWRRPIEDEAQRLADAVDAR
jgi:hypothetical protein